MKRILLVVRTELCVGGVPKVIMDIVQHLKDKYIFEVLTLSEKAGEYDDELLKCGGQLHRIHTFDANNCGMLFFLRPMQIKKKLKELFCLQKYDAIHCHSGFDSAVCLKTAKKYGIPVRIVHSHGVYDYYQGRNITINILQRIWKRQLNRYTTVRLTCSDVAGKSLYGNNSFINVLNPVDIKEYEGIEKKKHSGVNLVQVGYFCQRKNQIFSVKLLAELRRRGVDARLFMVGYKDEEDYYEELLKTIEDLGIGEYLEFLPSDYDKRGLFSYGDYSILPSESEGLPIVALESQAAKVKCLMSDRISKDSDVGNADFFEHDNLHAWAQGIIDDLADKNKKSPEFNGVSVEEYCQGISRFYKNIG